MSDPEHAGRSALVHARCWPDLSHAAGCQRSGGIGPAFGQGERRGPPRTRGDSPNEGINPDTYALDGGHPDERYVIGAQPGGWHVFYSERGLESGRRDFDTEDEACRHLLLLLRNDPTAHFHMVVGPLPAAEADVAFELWKKAADLVDIDAADIRIDNPVCGDGPLRRYWVRGTRLRAS